MIFFLRFGGRSGKLNSRSGCVFRNAAGRQTVAAVWRLFYLRPCTIPVPTLRPYLTRTAFSSALARSAACPDQQHPGTLPRLSIVSGDRYSVFKVPVGSPTLVELGQLKSQHIYLELLYVRWYDRFSRMGVFSDRGSPEDQQMLEELKALPELLPQYQKQVERFFDLVLDVDGAGRDPQQQASQQYLYDAPRDPELFAFRPIPLGFEPVEPGRCSPVLYSGSVRDMIDYALRSCVERGITVRRCKNCGRWFPQTGRVSAEYCERPVARGSRPAGRPGPSSSGPRSSLTTRCSRLTARNTRSVLPGSRQAVSPTPTSTPGASRPER